MCRRELFVDSAAIRLEQATSPRLIPSMASVVS
jgi:hypothetical protein